jgi:DNA-binding IclR family transcriptional regulator
MLILIEAFRNKRRNGEVALSTATTGMPRNTKARAARKLVDLGLIQLQEDGTGALRARVISDSYKKEENYKN